MNERQRAYASEIRTKPTVEAGIVYHKSNHGEPGPHSELIEYQPGNGTRYLLLLTWIRTIEGAAKKLGCQDDSVVVTDCLGRRMSMVLAPEGFLAPGYVAEKMGLGVPDAVAVAELLGHVLHREAISVEEWIDQYSEAGA